MSRQTPRRPGKEKQESGLKSRGNDDSHGAGDSSQKISSASTGHKPSGHSISLTWRLAILLVVAFAMITVAMVTDTPARICQHFAARALARFDERAASVWVDRAQRLSSRNPENELLAAKIARRRGDLQASASHLIRAQSLGASAEDIRLGQLLAAAQMGNLDGIEAELVAHLGNPGHDAAEISNAYANGLAMATRFDDAFTVLDAWDKDFPSDPRPPYRTGRLQEHLEQWEEAEASYRLALERNQDYFPARFALGRVLLTGRRVDPAMEEFRKCLSMPNPQAAKIELAACYRAKGQPESAAELLREVLAGEYEDLQASYKAVEDVPDYFEAASMLGDLEAEAENTAAALKWFQLAIEKNPRDLTARYGMALVLRQMDRTEEAEKEFTRVLDVRKALERANPLRDRISSNPEDLEARLELGELLLEHESQKMGLFWIRSIFTYDPDYPPAHTALAKYYRTLAKETPTHNAIADFHEQAASQSVSQ